jgi:hypothetical protein
MGDPYFTLTVELELEAAELASEIFHGNGCTGLELRDGSVQAMPGQRQPTAGHAMLMVSSWGQSSPPHFTFGSVTGGQYATIFGTRPVRSPASQDRYAQCLQMGHW